MCKLLLVPVGDDLRLANGKRGKVHWFWPERQPDGSMVLGYVQHQTTDAFRNSLIAIAPVILVPALLVGWCVLLLGTGVFADPFSAFRDAGIFSKVATIAAVVLGSRAAFPSPGDHVGALGAVFLLALTGGGVYAIYRADELVAALRVLAVVLAAPAAGVVINRVLLVPILSRSRN